MLNLSKIVNAFSSPFDDGEEELRKIPADHRNMTKFASADDQGYKSVSNTLVRWVREIKLREQQAFQASSQSCT